MPAYPTQLARLEAQPIACMIGLILYSCLTDKKCCLFESMHHCLFTISHNNIINIHLNYIHIKQLYIHINYIILY